MNREFEVAERQHGLITRSQLRNLGLSETAIWRRVQTGRLERVHRSVFRVVGSVRTDHQRVLAACSSMGTSSCASHITAARLLRLDGVDAGEIHVLVPSTVSLGRISGVRRHRTESLARADRRVVDGVPCTSAVRTIIDCAALLDEEALEAAFESARRLGLLTRTTLERRVAQLAGSGRPGSAALRTLLDGSDGTVAESRLEVRFARLLRSSELPPSIAQFRVGRYRLDRAWPDAKIAAECDGFEHHGDRLARKRDRRRIAALEAARWRVVHVTWDDLARRPREVEDRIRNALATLAA